MQLHLLSFLACRQEKLITETQVTFDWIFVQSCHDSFNKRLRLKRLLSADLIVPLQPEFSPVLDHLNCKVVKESLPRAANDQQLVDLNSVAFYR